MFYRFYFYTFYRHFKSGNRPAPSTRASATVSLTIFLLVMNLLSVTLGINHIMIPLKGILWLLAILIFVINYLIFDRNDRYKEIELEFDSSGINTRRNRMYCHIIFFSVFLIFFPATLYYHHMSIADMPLYRNAH
jgi:hypothetical protein